MQGLRGSDFREGPEYWHSLKLVPFTGFGNTTIRGAAIPLYFRREELSSLIL